jgi:hypothetical protein
MRATRVLQSGWSSECMDVIWRCDVAWRCLWLFMSIGNCYCDEIRYINGISG